MVEHGVQVEQWDLDQARTGMLLVAEEDDGCTHSKVVLGPVDLVHTSEARIEARHDDFVAQRPMLKGGASIRERR